MRPEDEFLGTNSEGPSKRNPPIQRIVALIRPTVSFLNHHLQSKSTPSLHVIGGKRTVESQIYKKEGLIEHTAQIAQPLSACIEKGVVAGAEVDAILHQVLDPNARHLLLACTHYEVLLNKLFCLERTKPHFEFHRQCNE